MRRFALHTALACTLAPAMLLAQATRGPLPPSIGMPGAMAYGGPAANSAAFLLAHTGELKLTDAQVVKLAAIARRVADRHRAMRARFDSVHARMGAARMDSAGRASLRAQTEVMHGEFAKFEEQARADRRDAIAVLTPDQQASAWELVLRSARPTFAWHGRSMMMHGGHGKPEGHAMPDHGGRGGHPDEGGNGDEAGPPR